MNKFCSLTDCKEPNPITKLCVSMWLWWHQCSGILQSHLNPGKQSLPHHLVMLGPQTKGPSRLPEEKQGLTAWLTFSGETLEWTQKGYWTYLISQHTFPEGTLQLTPETFYFQFQSQRSYWNHLYIKWWKLDTDYTAGFLWFHFWKWSHHIQGGLEKQNTLNMFYQKNVRFRSNREQM